MKTFTRGDVSFAYPADWSDELEESPDGAWTVTFVSRTSAFLLVSLRPDADDPAQVVDEALEALREEYKELDAADAQESVAGRPAVGHDIDFLTLDVPVVCRSRCLDTLDGALLLLTQVSEPDRAKAEPVFRAILASLRIDD